MQPRALIKFHCEPHIKEVCVKMANMQGISLAAMLRKMIVKEAKRVLDVHVPDNTTPKLSGMDRVILPGQPAPKRIKPNYEVIRPSVEDPNNTFLLQAVLLKKKETAND